MHQKDKGSLAKLMTSFNDVDKERDATVSERTYLCGEVELLKSTADELEEEGLKWQLTSEAYTECVNHLYYLLDPLVEKLLEDVVSNIRGLPETYIVKVKAMLPGSGEGVIPSPGEQLDQAKQVGKHEQEQGREIRLRESLVF